MHEQAYEWIFDYNEIVFFCHFWSHYFLALSLWCGFVRSWIPNEPTEKKWRLQWKKTTTAADKKREKKSFCFLFQFFFCHFSPLSSSRLIGCNNGNNTIRTNRRSYCFQLSGTVGLWHNFEGTSSNTSNLMNIFTSIFVSNYLPTYLGLTPFVYKFAIINGFFW